MPLAIITRENRIGCGLPLELQHQAKPPAYFERVVLHPLGSDRLFRERRERREARLGRTDTKRIFPSVGSEVVLLLHQKRLARSYGKLQIHIEAETKTHPPDAHCGFIASTYGELSADAQL